MVYILERLVIYISLRKQNKFIIYIVNVIQILSITIVMF